LTGSAFYFSFLVCLLFIRALFSLLLFVVLLLIFFFIPAAFLGL
jgi:hypothetical protein